MMKKKRDHRGMFSFSIPKQFVSAWELALEDESL